VRLSKLKLAGFKTFVDPTTVQFPGNLVGVVGPNGCGKSNIIDAVRWVLGESRASALRGESMQDVIFNGSTTRKPVSRSSVELVFDNLTGRAGGQWSRYAEIAVKRVLDRSGESSYFINNTQVRRKDVIDLFLGTGLGPRAYAIIEQGMISRIIEARPEDIRGFLEEAAGVTKYRERRKETEYRLRDARDNLARLDDIRLELGERIGHLETQAAVAARYQALSAAHVEKQQLLWLLKRTEAQAEHIRQHETLQRLSLQIEADSARLHELENQVEEARSAHFGAAEEVHVAQSALFAASAEVSRLESELQHLASTRQRLESRIGELAGEHTHWLQGSAELEEESGRWQELAENASLREEQSRARHEEVLERMPELENAWRDDEAALQEARRALNLTQQQLGVERTRLASAERSLDNLAQRRQRLEAEGGDIALPDEDQLMALEARVETLELGLAERQQALADAQHALPASQAALRQAQQHERELGRNLTSLKARSQALEQLQAQVQSQGKLGDWLKAHGLDQLPPLWTQLQVATGWERAVQAVLRERLAALLDDGQGRGRQLLDQPPPESFALLLAGEPLPALALPAATGAFAELPALRTQVSVLDPALDSVVSSLLAGVHCCAALEEAIADHQQLPAGVVLVNAAGQLLSRHVLSHVSADHRTQGVLEREREIEQLHSQLVALEEEQDFAHETMLLAEQALAAQQESIERLRQDSQQLQSQLHGEQLAALKLRQEHERARERAAQLARELAELDQLEASEQTQLAGSERELERAGELLALQQEGLELGEQRTRASEQALQQLRALEREAARSLQEAGFAVRECSAKLADVARHQQLASRQLERIDQEQQTCRSELEACADERSQDALQTALALRDEREAALACSRDALESASARLKQYEEMRLRTEHEAAPLRQQLAELRLAVQASELAVSQFAERLIEAGADEAALLPLLHPELKESSLQREVARLGREISELGAVNLAAVEELRQSSERKQFLDEQNEDLLQAITTLEDAIRRIDRETRLQLLDTYQAVNRQFSSLFPQLFGGGRAELVLTGDEILDAGIQIIAQPPGKKNASIHLLSGGEKALTAIALVFSLFQLNPAPFCMLDEVDAPLDDSNTERYANMVKRMSAQTQFIFISHSKITMEFAQQLVGVTMQEQGVSRVVEVDIEEALRLAEPAAA
jgi:chromosome segregation protein